MEAEIAESHLNRLVDHYIGNITHHNTMVSERSLIAFVEELCEDETGRTFEEFLTFLEKNGNRALAKVLRHVEILMTQIKDADQELLVMVGK